MSGNGKEKLGARAEMEMKIKLSCAPESRLKRLLQINLSPVDVGKSIDEPTFSFPSVNLSFNLLCWLKR